MQQDPGDVQPSATMMNVFNCFPVELHHQILSFMDPEGILALRKTCKYFLALTQEPRLWDAVYHRMQETHPLSCSQGEFAALPTWQSERLLVRASKTEKLFQTFREHSQHHIVPDGQTRKTGPLTALSFLSERFILSGDDTTVVYVWDMSKLASSGDAPCFPCARLTLVGWCFVAYGMTIDQSTLYVVLVKSARAHIFSLSLPLSASDTHEPKLSFRNVAYFDTRFNDVKSIDADLCLVLLGDINTIIEVVDWRTESRSSFPLHQDITEASPMNLVLALRFCGPYILCFRHHSIDAYPIPVQFLKPEFATNRYLPVLQHTIVGMKLSLGISLSRVRHSRSPSGDVYTICALAEHKHRGMFHYQVHVHLTPDPLLSVQLLGYEGTHTNRQVSAWDLGPTGLRGAWVLGPNSKGDRHVVTFTTYPDQYLFEPGTMDMPPEIAPRLGGRVVSAMSWRDSDGACLFRARYVVLDDDVSEFTGQIALGSQTGAITLL